MKVHVLKIPTVKLNQYTGSFISCALKPTFTSFGYGDQLSSSKLKTMSFKIKLPIKNKEIDFDFITKYPFMIYKADFTSGC